MRQNLVERVPAQLVLRTRRTLDHPVRQHLLTNLFPFFHVASHVLGTSKKPFQMGLTRHLPTSTNCTHVRCHFHPVFPRPAPPFSTGINT